jgi:hypothetical protein
MAEKINYRAVLRDLKEKQKKIGVAIEAIEGILASEKPETIVVASQPAANGLTMLDAAQKVLQAAGKPLHAREIAERLIEHGKQTSMNSVAASLGKDAQNRFRNIGQNTWELAQK